MARKRKGAPISPSTSLVSPFSEDPSLPPSHPHSEAPLSSPAIGPFKDSLGRYRIQTLFEGKGLSSDESLTPLFTLEPTSPTGLPSFKRVYVEIGDPSEYEQAIQMFGSWEQWTRLVESPWFKPYLNEAREELNAKMRSRAVKKIMEDGDGAFSEATRLAANKFLATGGYLVEAEKEVVKEVAKRGRPSKEEIERRTKEIITEEMAIKADYERITGGSTKEVIN